MDYFEWNQLITKYFFNSNKAGEEVILFIAQQDIIDIAKNNSVDDLDDDIWNNFLTRIQNGPPDTGIHKNIFEKALQTYENYKNYHRKYKEADGTRIKYPPYILYLVFSILPLIEIQGDYNATNYFNRLNDFLKKNNINQNLSGKLNLIEPLWSDLLKWANKINNGDLGVFKLPHFTNPKRKFVFYPFSQCIFPPKSIQRLQELFLKSGMIPEHNYSSPAIKNYLLQYGSSILNLPSNTLNVIRNESNELGQSIVDIFNREYKKWTGETHEEIEEGTTVRKKRNYTVAPLFLQFKVNTNDEEIKFSYRMYSSNDYPEDLKFSEHQNLYEINGWSKTLPLEFIEGLELKDNFNKWIAKFPDRDVRLFVSAGTFQLSNDFWIETDFLSRTERMYLLCKSNKQEQIKEWGKTFGNGNFKQEDFEGLPENYSLFWFRNPTQGLNDISILTLYTEKRIELVGGLKVNFRTYVNDFLPEVEIINSDGNEKAYLQYKGADEKIFLSKKTSLNNRWLLPEKTAIKADFYIKVENENFAGNELAYNLASSDNTALKIDGSKLPKRNSFGRNIITDAEQYCLGSNIVNPAKSSKRVFCPLSWIFASTHQETTTTISTAVFNNHSGNNLCNFLSLKSMLTTEEFFKAFEFYFSKEFSITENTNLTKLKRASLNFYDFIGILDYDYETKGIVLNPPQFIFIPTTQGRKVLLIGARDAALIKAIIEKSPSHNLQVEITKQFPSNERLLLPDVITIKAFGTSSENYGERNLKALADELQIKFSNDYFPQLALQDFSANIADYETTLQETNENDYGWARYIFNPETLRFEKSEIENFDKSFSLLEYKLNEYTYQHKLWKDSKCYQVDMNWGRFIALKHFNKNVILFDSTNKKVAIPVETPLPRLLSEAIMLLSGLAPDFKEIDGKKYRVYENVIGIFTQNLFRLKLGQTAKEKAL